MGSDHPAVPKVYQNQAESRFEIALEGKTSVLVYKLSEHELALLHTNVPEPLRGNGLGTLLAAFAMEYARLRGLKVVVQCPFVEGFLEHHPEYAGLIRKE
jgi:predicted GNAT family acetyltransferase